VAKFVPFGQGYGKLFYGRVVDMLYFPLVDMPMPRWVPFVGGKKFVFFEPVFNIADAAISIGVLTLVLFQKRLIHKKEEPAEVTTTV
jgi:signal peptidase II